MGLYTSPTGPEPLEKKETTREIAIDVILLVILKYLHRTPVREIGYYVMDHYLTLLFIHLDQMQQIVSLEFVEIQIQ